MPAWKSLFSGNAGGLLRHYRATSGVSVKWQTLFYVVYSDKFEQYHHLKKHQLLDRVYFIPVDDL